MSWYLGTVQLAASATAQRNRLHLIDLTAAAGDVTITLPVATLDPTYVGVVIKAGPGNGAKVVKVLTDGGVQIAQISATGAGAWFAADPAIGSNWVLAADSNPSEYDWVWANATERLATDLFSGQVGRVGYQTDLELEYELLDDSPLRWGPVPPTDCPLNVWHGWTALAQNAGGTHMGCNGGAFVGTAGARTPTAGSAGSELLRFENLSAAGAGSSALYSANGAKVAFNFRSIFRGTLGSVSGAMRWFMGWQLGGGLAPGNVNPNTFTDCIGIARCLGTDANVQLIHNDAAGVATQVDLGASFPAATLNVGYELRTLSPALGSWRWAVRNLNTGAEVSGTLAANIPSVAGLIPSFYVNNNTDAVAVSLDCADFMWAQRTR